MTLKNFKFSFDIDGNNCILKNHLVHNKPMLPGVTWLNILAQALEGINCDPTQFTFRNIVFKSPLILERQDKKTVEISFDLNTNSFEVTSDAGLTSHCIGQIFSDKPEILNNIDVSAPNSEAVEKPLKEIYEFARTIGIHHGSWMQGTGTAYLEGDRVVADISLSIDAESSKNKYLLHPAIFDSATIVPFASGGLNQSSDEPFIPLTIKAFRARKIGFESVRIIARQTPDQISNQDILHNDLLFVNKNGETLCEISQLSAKRIRGTDAFDANISLVAKQPTVPQSGLREDTNILSWLKKFFARHAELDDKLDAEIGFYDLGLNSAQLLELSGKLQEEVGMQVHPTLLYEYSSIHKLANWLAGQGFVFDRFKQEETEGVDAENWLYDLIDTEFKLPNKPSFTQGFYEIGLDSGQLLTLANLIENKLGFKLHPTICYEQNTISKLALYLVQIGALNSPGLTSVVPNHDEFSEEDINILLGQYKTSWLKLDKPINEIDRKSTIDYAEFQSESDIVAAMNHDEKSAHLIWKPKDLSPAQLLKEAITLGKTIQGSLKAVKLTVFGIDRNAGNMLVPLFRSLTREFPLLTVRVISGAIDDKLPDFGIVRSGVEWINFKNDFYYLQTLELVRNLGEPSLSSADICNEGAVLVSGGKGAIGLALVEELFAIGFTKFSLVGRNDPSEHSRLRIEKLQSLGAEIQVLNADVVDINSISKAWEKVKIRFERVSGVIHAAGIADDSMLINKYNQKAQAVLAVKYEALKNLDVLSANENLEFFVACGSTTGVIGNFGQTDYAFANGSMIAFMEERRIRMDRKGSSICINWPFWKDGGFQIDEYRLNQLRNETAISPLKTCVAKQAFRFLLNTKNNEDETSSTIFPVIFSDATKFEEFVSGLGINIIRSSKTQMSLNKFDDEKFDKIAIVGLAGEYPKARTNEELWSLLFNGIDGVTEIPPDRWDHDTVYQKNLNSGGVYAKHGGFISNHDRFDAEFFNIPPEEARLLDPQERKFLEVAWRTIESAAIDPFRLKGSNTGVYVGVMWGQYQLQPQDKTGRRAASIYASIANRVSYSLDFTGPSMAVDSMCSSSLTALHLAVESLKRGECDLAIAGGVNLMSDVQKYQFLCQNHMLSTNGRCNSFGEDGDGYVPGEGVGAVLLKPYKRAIEDGDPILAIISASALSHGGRGGGMTVPNPEAQASVIKRAHQKANAEGKVGYIEAHGTGTSLGDPIEISGLMKALSENQKEQCYIGSIKSNIGHLEGAAGIASIAKTILQMQNATIVPSLHCETLNPKLAIASDFFTINRENRPWSQEKKIAAISAFGAGGSNAHIVLEEHAYESDLNQKDKRSLLSISGKNNKNLVQYVKDWISYLQSDIARSLCFGDIAATSISSRHLHEKRLVIIACSVQEAHEILVSWLTRNDGEVVETNVILGENDDSDLVNLASDVIDGREISLPEHRRVIIPVYPFVGEHYWIEPARNFEHQSLSDSINGYFLHRHIESDDGTVWNSEWSTNDGLIQQHKFNNNSILPAALILQTAYAAAKKSFGSSVGGFAEAKIGRMIPVDKSVELKIETFENAKTKYVEISNSLISQISFQASVSKTDLSAEKDKVIPDGEKFETTGLYNAFERQGLSYGPIYRSIRNYEISESGEIWAKLEYEKLSEKERSVIAIDGALQCAAICLGDIAADQDSWLPVSFENIQWYGELSSAQYVHCKQLEENTSQRVFEISVYDEQGQRLWRVERFYLNRVGGFSKDIKSDTLNETKTAEIASDHAELKANFKTYFVKILSEQTGFSADVISTKNDFSKLGVDSVIVMRVTGILEEFIGSIAKTVFFDYQSVNDLCDYLFENYMAEISEFLGKTIIKQPLNSQSTAKSSGINSVQAELKSARPPKKHGAKEPLAIIGLALKAPGAKDVDEFWKNLQNGINSVSEIPSDRWPAGIFSERNSKKVNYCRKGGFIDKPYEFDPGFFEMTPADCQSADPTERLFLETAWLAAEDAGYTRKSLRETNVGVYVASMWQQHQLMGNEESFTGQSNANLSILSSVANRVSGALGLSGPSISLDTMCSGSLTALHLASTAISLGECDAAIVGGVNLSLHPTKFAALSQRGFLSKKGHCAAFGAEADGYVPAEAVVAILVKPLSKAIEDKDPIYATVLGTSLNHVGTSNGSTVPTSKSQAEALARAIECAEISPNVISYVEAHGTGTVLGDPIELNGLEKVLGKSGEDKRIKFGSVKSNIGHAEGAAGLVGLAKVVLQFKYETLVPTLHIEKINPEISLENSVLEPVIQRETWNPGEPKFATVSSFGAGGSNACVVLQSYSHNNVCQSQNRATIIKISSHKNSLLIKTAQELCSKLRSPDTSYDLESVAATLHRGREDRACRLAIIAESIEELCEKLDGFVNGQNRDGVYFSQDSKRTEFAEFFADIDGRDYLETLIFTRKLRKLAKLWVSEIEVDWKEFYCTNQYLSLPTTIFEKTDFAPNIDWYDFAYSIENTSDFDAQKYEITIPGFHPILAHHYINGRAQLSLAGVTQIAKKVLDCCKCANKKGLSIKMLSPCIVEESLKLEAEVYMQGDDFVIEFWSGDQKIAEAMTALHFGGQLEVSEIINSGKTTLSFYQDFENDGYSYDTAYRAINNIETSANCTIAGLTPFRREYSLLDDALDVGQIDSAMQLTRVHLSKLSSDAWLPTEFHVCNIEDLKGAQYVACVERKSSENQVDFDAYWFDGDYVALGTGSLTMAKVSKRLETEKLGYFMRSWVEEQEESILEKSATSAIRISSKENKLLDEIFQREITALNSLALILEYKDRDDVTLYDLWKLVNDAKKNKLRNLTIGIVASELSPHLAGLTSWLSALQEEFPTYRGSVIISDIDLPSEKILADAKRGQTLFRYEKGKKFVQGLKRAHDINDHFSNADIQGKSFLITGGAGGLGRVIARHLASNYGANLILTGRSSTNEKIEAQISDLKSLGSEVIYVQADITDIEQVDRLSKIIERRFGSLFGIIHAAGTNDDRWITDQSFEQVESVIAPKVQGIRHLAKLVQSHDSQIVVGVSSISGFLGNPGQSDYSYANAFMDHYLATEIKQNCRTVTVCWPLWKGVGMQISAEIAEAMRKSYGLEPLPISEGILAFDQAIQRADDRILCTFGDQTKIQSWLEAREVFESSTTSSKTPQAIVTSQLQNSSQAISSAEELAGCAIESAKKLVANALKETIYIEESEINWTKPTNAFGLSSVVSAQIISVLEADIGTLPKTLMFECENMEDLATYIAQNKSFPKSAPNLSLTDPEVSNQTHEVPPIVEPKSRTSNIRRGSSNRYSYNSVEKDIAIIGSACKFPSSDTMSEFWDIIANGKDAVTPIPKERWDGDQYPIDAPEQALRGGFIDGIKNFDNEFFEIYHGEALAMDPQERLVLQTAWHSLEDANIRPSDISGKQVGVYVGAMWNQYQLIGENNLRNYKDSVATNSSFASFSNRISYLLNLHGPSLTLDTMCSSSLMAVKLAVDALRAGEIETAIVAGVNASVHPYKYYQLNYSKFLSPEGRCRAFGDGGDGYVPSEGVGVLVLRRLSDASASGNRIRGVIKGIGVSHGGRANGFTVPRPQQQAMAINLAISDAAIDSSTVSYIEAHGTGTSLGDPIEVRGIKMSYGQNPKFRASIGSVKSNIGHAESASGMASIFKVLLQFEYSKLAPTIHCETLNPQLELDDTGLTISKSLMDWEFQGDKRRAGISSFGAGGTNLHLILEEGGREETNKLDSNERSEIVVLSAANEDRLRILAKLYIEQFDDANISLASIAATTQMARDSLRCRLVCIAQSKEQFVESMRSWLDNIEVNNVWFSPKNDNNNPILVAPERSDLQKCALDWINGNEVSWIDLWNTLPPQVELPKYPFEEKPIWFENIPSLAASKDENRTLLKAKEQITSRHVSEQTTFEKVASVLADIFKFDLEELDPTTSFDRFGMESVSAKLCSNKLSEIFGINVKPTWFYNYPNTELLSKAVHKAISSEATDQCLESKVDTDTNADRGDEKIAIIGISGAFAGAADTTEFWQNLVDGLNSVKEVPASRWDIDECYSDDASLPNKTISRKLGAIEGVKDFDPVAFNLVPEEALGMDPQQRLFIKHSAQAVDNAGISYDQIQGTNCGVFAGAMTSSYRSLFADGTTATTAMSMLGNHSAVLPARVAYWLNLKGPSICIDTACSSSLVAIDLACKAILNGECETALAGGVFVCATSDEFISSSQAGMLSPDGQCKTFDDEANGIAMGEGVGVVFLKPLSLAIADGDPIHATICASGSNQDGRSNGITAPNLGAQEALIKSVLNKADLDPTDIDYFECHGTGTKLGDPVEIGAITNAIGLRREVPLPIGSVKPNVGHCYAAAGMAGLFKCIGVLKDGVVPPSILCNKPNSLINFEESGVYVVKEALKLPRKSSHICSLSAFGYSGTNTHMILRSAPEEEAQNNGNAFFVPLSARKAGLVISQARSLAKYLTNNPIPLEKIACTLQRGRRHEKYRAGIIVSDLEALIKWLNDLELEDIKSIKTKQLGAIEGGEEELLSAFLEGRDFKSSFKPGAKRASIPGKTYDEKTYWPDLSKKQSATPISVGDKLYADQILSNQKQLRTDNGIPLLQSVEFETFKSIIAN